MEYLKMAMVYFSYHIDDHGTMVGGRANGYGSQFCVFRATPLVDYALIDRVNAECFGDLVAEGIRAGGLD